MFLGRFLHKLSTHPVCALAIGSVDSSVVVSGTHAMPTAGEKELAVDEMLLPVNVRNSPAS
jgi:hypothetical protein